MKLYLLTVLGVAYLVTAQEVIDEASEEKREIHTPQVVLQLKYQSGELNRIYLAQYRNSVNTLDTSVPARSSLCADLCHAGLGGDVCGPSCLEMLPVGLKSALNTNNRSDVVYGEPRISVCPTLCENHLGYPLCGCANSSSTEVRLVDWHEVCATFCITDRYVLGGCPPCSESTNQHGIAARVLATSEGWVAWCNVQCGQGQGGAACNCDRAPFQ